MSSPSDSPLGKSTEDLSNDSQTTQTMQGTTDWDGAIDTVAKLVSEFLATRGDTTPSIRADIVFESLSVDGWGRAVSSSTVL